MFCYFAVFCAYLSGRMFKFENFLLLCETLRNLHISYMRGFCVPRWDPQVTRRSGNILSSCMREKAVFFPLKIARSFACRLLW